MAALFSSPAKIRILNMQSNLSKKGAKRNVKKNTQNHIQQLERLSPAKTTTTFLIVDTMRKETTRRQLVITLTANSAAALRW